MSFPPCSTHLYCLMSSTCLHGSDSCSDISSSGVPPGALFTASRWLLRWSDCDMYRWPQESTTCPPSERLSSRPLKFGKVIPVHSWEQPSLDPQHTLLLIEIFTKSSLLVEYADDWFKVLQSLLCFLATTHPTYVPPLGTLHSLCPGFSLILYFPTLDPLINGMLFFKLHKRPAY